MSARLDWSDATVQAVVAGLLPSVSALVRHRVGQAVGLVPVDVEPVHEGAALLAALLSVTAAERAGGAP